MTLLATSYAWILDVAFFAILAIGLIIGCARGFVKGVCKLAGTIFSLIVAFFFCPSLQAQLEEWFGLTTMISDAIGSANVGGWITIGISFVALVILVKLVTWLIGTIGKKLVHASKGLAAIDRFLGAILGAVEALLFIFVVLMLFNWMQFEAVDMFIAESWIVNGIYNSMWFLKFVNLPGRILGIAAIMF